MRVGVLLFLTMIVSPVLALSAMDQQKEIRASSTYREALAKGAHAAIMLRVRDEAGNSVSNAQVSAVFDMHPNPLASAETTDGSGACLLEELTCGNSIVIRVEKPGFYPSERKLCLAGFGCAHQVLQGRWQPYPMEEALILRRIRNPVRLVAVDRNFDMPGTNSWYGFDMAVADFVAPYGIGKVADFECRAEWDGRPAWESRHCAVHVRFTERFAGGCTVRNTVESAFPFPYVADSTKMDISSFEIIDRNGDPHTSGKGLAAGTSLTVRTRCVADDAERLKAANYGNIRRIAIGPSRRGKAILSLGYVFNTSPNDTNLEPCR